MHSDQYLSQRSGSHWSNSQNIRHGHLAFSVDNILSVVTEVDYEVLLLVLEIPSFTKTAIENEYTSADERKRAAVHYFVQNHSYASWRLLILNFDQKYVSGVADKISHLAETLTDATFTHENVSAVLTSVPTRNLSSVLWIPESRLKQIQTLSPSEIDERINLINYFIKCSVLAEWSSLAGLLYFYQHLVPLAAAKKFITTARESTLTLDTLKILLSNVNWRVVGSWLQIPNSKLEMIRFSTESQCREACWKLFLEEHPCPSWRLIGWSLIYCGYHKELQEIQKYLRVDEESNASIHVSQAAPGPMLKTRQPTDEITVAVNPSPKLNSTFVNAKPPYEASKAASIQIRPLSPSMSQEQFFIFLQTEGLPEDDYKILKNNQIKAKTFISDLTERDIDSNELGNFTFIGRRVLKRLLQKGSKDSTKGDEKNSSSTNVKSLPTHRISQEDDSTAIAFNEAERETTSVDGRHGRKITIEYFEPYRIDHSSKPRSVRFTFGVVQPENRKDRTSAISTYDMERFPHGIALIINNELFTAKEMSFRKGTAIDERNLTHVFRYLGYKVEVHRDLKSQEMTEVMFEMGKRNHQMYDSFVCCILSHGTEGHVYGTDGATVSLHFLTRIVDADNCPTLHGKPKLFFLQACRGRMKERAVSTDSGESTPLQTPRSEWSTSSPTGDHRSISTDSDNKIPASADFFFGYATPLGYVAWRDDNYGSWYISELCRSLCEMYRYASLNDIMAKVHERVACGDEYEYIDYKVSPESTTRLHKNVFF